MAKKILVVDDEEAIRFTLQVFLNDEGYEVGLAANYDDAVKLIREEPFDLLFVDIFLEGKSGIELLQTIKKGNPNAQVIIITGAPSVESAAECLRLGAIDYITKPIREATLLKVTRLALRHKQLSDDKDYCQSNLEAVFKSVKDIIITVDDKMLVLNVNAAAAKLCGITQDSITDVSSFSTMTENCSGSCIEILQEVLTNKKAAEVRHIECRHKNAPGQIVSVSASPLINHLDNFSGCVMVVRDETRLYYLEKNAKEDKAFSRMIGVCKEMKKIKSLIRALADVQTTVLITGESGTGKELAMEALHNASDRCHGPLVKVNCGALSDSILESELFGHVQGAFTGAVNNRPGRFHLANGGTIFLDEIGDISSKMQLQLLRVIETMTFERVGSSKSEQVDIRVIAATNRDLAQKVAAGEFRKDLYYRLKVIAICLPPLRERKDDILLLTQHMMQKFNRKFKKKIKALTSDVEKLFHLYPWPGNIRELENSMEHAFILCSQNTIALPHLPIELQEFSSRVDSFSNGDRNQEAEFIKLALQETDGNKAKAARLLSMSRRTIYRKIEKYDIDS